MGKNIYRLKPSKAKKEEAVCDCDYCYKSVSLEAAIRNSLTKLVNFIHAFSGCDTTFSFQNQGRKK